MNLAQSNVLQCLQQPLDNGFISVETNGNCLLRENMHKNFALIATLNPNKGAFAGKRNELGLELLSRFQKIHFPDISKNEMKKIVFGIAKNKEYIKEEDKKKNKDYKKSLIEKIVDLHFDIERDPELQDDIQCLTIREIETVIECLKNENEEYDVIMTIYGGRFRQEKKEILKKKLSSVYGIKKKLFEKIDKKDDDELPKDFPSHFSIANLIETVKSVLLALRNKRNVMIIGKDENGLTQVAEWCSKYFNKISGGKNKSYICYCTRNLECSDLIGTQKLSDASKKENEIIVFKPRFLYKAINKGNCIVLDSINEAPSRVIERLNGLLDKKNSKKEEKFEVPEDSTKSEISIHKNFRIICTSSFKNVSQISPSFVNRFLVIVLEDQLKIKDKEMKNLIQFLCEKYQKEYYDNYKKRKEKQKNNKNIKIEEKINVTEEIIDLIFEKMNNIRNLKKPDEYLQYSTAGSSISPEFDENSKKYLTMSSINKFCRSFIIFKNKFANE